MKSNQKPGQVYLLIYTLCDAIVAPLWRTMSVLITMNKEKETARISLRLPKEYFNAIDRIRLIRAGNISRNTWIAEAITEKLERELTIQRKEAS